MDVLMDFLLVDASERAITFAPTNSCYDKFVRLSSCMAYNFYKNFCMDELVDGLSDHYMLDSNVLVGRYAIQ